MGQIKPIETLYNGYRFRSRLEARWAVFFDALGVPYEYEPEGFELPNGECYLPDFKVKCYGTRGERDGNPFDLWIEVKGEMTEKDANKIKAFANFPNFAISSDDDLDNYLKAINEANPVLIVSAFPRNTYGFLGGFSDTLRYFERFGTPAYNYELIDQDYFDAWPAATKDGRFYLFGADSNYINNDDMIRVDEAYEKARQARFEHGETPTF